MVVFEVQVTQSALAVNPERQPQVSRHAERPGTLPIAYQPKRIKYKALVRG